MAIRDQIKSRIAGALGFIARSDAAPGGVPVQPTATKNVPGDAFLERVASGLVARSDGLINELSGIGTSADKSAVGVWTDGSVINVQLARKIYRSSSYARRIVQELPRDAMRHGWTVSTPDDQMLSDEVDDFDHEMGIARSLRNGFFAARRDSDAWLWVVVADGLPLSQPLNLDGSFEILAVHVMDKNDLTPDMIGSDPADPVTYRRPVTYRIQGNSGTVSVSMSYQEIHYTRLIHLVGDEVDWEQWHWNGGYNDSVFQTTENAIRAQEESDRSLTTLISEARLDVFKMGKQSIKPTDRTAGNGSGRARITAAQAAAMALNKVRTLARMKSAIGMAVIDEGDELTRMESGIQGLENIINARREATAASLDMPMVQLFGIPPAGMSSDDEASARDWRQAQADFQTDQMAPALQRWYTLVFAASNGPGDPGRWMIEMGDVDEPNALDQATVSEKMAGVDKIYQEMGVPSDVILLARMSGEEMSTTLPMLPTNVQEQMQERLDALELDDGSDDEPPVPPPAMEPPAEPPTEPPEDA